ncbi:fatty acid 2-hydroxylase-like, partial [Saccoglossus kowalevskii]|uniref:Fatty acid 2-hydroxylase-like n=1 Tax=Saccoglossus kowalevskii TaxID=10224 RepID=A0ABM0GXW7_SACKO
MEAITEQEIDCLIKKGSIIFIKRNKVYDVSEFANQMKHPGGREVLTEHVGKDVASVMKGATHSHSQNAYKLMEGFCIGQLVKEEDETQEKELPPQNEEIESLVDWNKAMVWQVQKLGEKYENWIHSPVDRPMRIFQTTAMELLTMTPWYMVLVIWVPVMTLFMQMSLRKWGNDIISFEVIGDHKVFIPDRSFSLVFLLGLLLWTLIEYCLHRFLFHLVPPSSSPTLMRIHFLLHGIHHK